MSWATLAANQMVSFIDAQGSGFTLKSGQSHINSPQCMTRANMNLRYNVLDPTSYLSNELVPKSAWAAPVAIPSYSCGSTLQTIGGTGSMDFVLGTTSGSVTYDWEAITNYTWYIQVTYNGVIKDSFTTDQGVWAGTRSFNYVYDGSNQSVRITYSNIS